MKISKIQKSRSAWKDKAVRRGKAIRELKKSAKARERIDQQSDLINEVQRLKDEIDQLKNAKAKLPLGSGGSSVETQRRTLCVCIVIIGVVSFRAVPRLLNVFRPLLNACVDSPHFTSVIHWTLRAGVAIFNQVGLVCEPWIAIIDCTIDVGTRKALVVLRVPLAALSRKEGAVGLSDCECIGLEVSHKWNGQLVYEALDKVFERAGHPIAIIKDGGTDLNKGVAMIRAEKKELRIHVIEDIGHYTANALKATYATAKPFIRFLNIVSQGASRIRQTNLAWLLPPKIRTKGRFQGITAVAEWAQKMLDVIGGQGRAKDGTDVDFARQSFAGLAQLRPFLTGFCQVAAICDKIQKLLKTQGLNQETHSAAGKLLATLSDKSPVKTRLVAWLERHFHIHRTLEMGAAGLMVSSDVIESLFGKFKTVIQRNPQCELNRMIYVIPLLCGNHSATDIDHALKTCSHEEMLRKIEQTIPQTLRQQRVRELEKRSTAGPKSGGFKGSKEG